MTGGSLPAPSATHTWRPAPRERTRRTGEIIDAARAILEAEGPANLTMRRLGDDLGIRAPSLYKHLPGKPALELALIEQALDETGLALHGAVGNPGPDQQGPIHALLVAYRAIGSANPNLYRLVTGTGLDRTELLPGLEEWAGEPFYLVTGEPYLAQALWSFAHGTLVLELDHRFLAGSDLDRTWRTGADAFAAACR